MNQAKPYNTPELLNVPEAAKYLRVSERSLFTRTKEGSIPVIRIGARKFYDRASLDKCIRQFEQGGGALRQL